MKSKVRGKQGPGHEDKGLAFVLGTQIRLDFILQARRSPWGNSMVRLVLQIDGSSGRRSMDTRAIEGLGRSVTEVVATVQVTWYRLL